MNLRLVLALCGSTVAHVGVAWYAVEKLASFAAPAQRALTVAMAPAAPRPVLNAIAPSATAALSPAPVESLSPPSVQSLQPPQEPAVLMEAQLVPALGPRTTRSQAPAKARVLRDVAPSAVTPMLAVTRESAPVRRSSSVPSTRGSLASPIETRVSVSEASFRELPSKQAPAQRRRHPASAVDAGAVPAKLALAGEPGAGGSSSAPARVAGEPGAEREARPAAGNEPPVYPWTARAQGQEGRVVLRVWVSALGEPGKLDVWRSSGYRALDRAALRAVAKWHFVPARRGGRDADSLVHVPVVFRLEDG